MPAWYWAMIWFAVACTLAAPVCYRILHAQRQYVSKGRWRLYSWLCAALFCLGVGLLAGLGTLYPKQNPAYGFVWDSESPFRKAMLRQDG